MTISNPENWDKTKLVSLLEDEFPGVWGQEPKHNRQNVRVLRSTDIDSSGHINYETAANRYVSGDVLAAKSLKYQDILLEASGGGPNTPVGRVAWFSSPDEEIYVCSNFFRTLRPNKDTNSRFLVWKLLWFYQQSSIWLYQQQTTGIINLKTSEYLKAEFGIPPYEEQRLIAAILDTVDDAIRYTEQLIDKLKKVRAGLLHDLLTYGIDENGDLRDPKRHPEQFTDSVLGLIPNEWIAKPLGCYTLSSAFGPRFPSSAYDENGNVAVTRTTDMDNEGNISLATMPTATLNLDVFRTHLLEPNDLLISRSGTCGIAAVFPGFEISVLPGAFLIRFRLSAELHPQFIRRYFNWETGRSRLLIEAEGGVQKNIKGSAMLRLAVPVPPESEQDRILSVLTEHEDRIDAEMIYLSKLYLIKQGLMDDLLTGRVCVTDLLNKRG